MLRCSADACIRLLAWRVDWCEAEVAQALRLLLLMPLSYNYMSESQYGQGPGVIL